MKLSDLTPRERQVAELVAMGLAYRDVALRLPNLRSHRGGCISVETVKHHVGRIADKIGGDGLPRRRVVLWFHSAREAA